MMTFHVRSGTSLLGGLEMFLLYYLLRCLLCLILQLILSSLSRLE